MNSLDAMSDDNVIFVGEWIATDIQKARKVLTLTAAEMKAFQSALKRKDASTVRATLKRIQELAAERTNALRTDMSKE